MALNPSRVKRGQEDHRNCRERQRFVSVSLGCKVDNGDRRRARSKPRRDLWPCVWNSKEFTAREHLGAFRANALPFWETVLVLKSQTETVTLLRLQSIKIETRTRYLEFATKTTQTIYIKDSKEQNKTTKTFLCCWALSCFANCFEALKKAKKG